MRDFLRVLGVARRHAVWVAIAAAAMVVAAGATVFAYNLVRPLYDSVLAGAGGTAPPATVEGPLVRLLDELTRALREWLRPVAGSGPAPVLVVVLLALGAKNLGTLLARFAGARFGLATIRDLRSLLFDALLGQTPGALQRATSGVLVSRVISDVQLIHEALSERFGDLLQDTVTVVLLLGYLFSLDPVLAAATVVLAPLLLAPVLHFSRRLRVRSRQAQEQMGELTTVLGETLSGIRVVQAFGMQEVVRARFRRAVHAQFLAQLRARTIQAANAPVMEMVGAAGAMALVAYAAGRIGAGRMTLGDFTAFLVAAYGAYNPVKRLNKFNLALQQASVAASRVYAVIDAPPAVRDRPGAGHLESIGDGVRLEGVSFAYEPGLPVLDRVDLVLPRGRTVALVGPSGAGKTTVAHLLLRFSDPDRGAVLVGGRDVRTVTLESLRSHIGLVTQEPLLFDDTVEANIVAGRAPDPSPTAVDEAARQACADGFIRDLPDGPRTRIGEGGARLSAGQRQRLALARALYRDPEILILDEPTAALDAESERSVMDALGRAAAGRTTLLIAHQLVTARRADSIVVLDRGRVVEEGTHRELMERGGLYRRLVEAQERPA